MVLTFHIILAILTPLYAVPLLAYLSRFRRIRLVNVDVAGKIVKESLNLVIPAALTSVAVLVVNLSILSFLGHFSLSSIVSLDYANEPTLFGVTFTALNSLFWFVGIHGYYALLPLVDLLQEASNLNYSTVLAGGEGHYHMNLSFMGAFVFIGGSGATLSLVIALLILSNQRSVRLIALASIPIGLLNINEILLFGLPIIFNPRLFLPFLFAPMVNVVVSMVVVSLGLVATPSVAVPFNSPIFINAYMATGGDVNAVILQIVNIGLGVLVYIPAVKMLNSTYMNRAIHIPALDTSFSRLQEEAKTLRDDPVAELIRQEKERAHFEQELQLLSRKDFALEYQPQVCPLTNKTVGREALIRSVDEKGQLQAPYTFLPWLEKAGLMQEVDLWVIKQAVKDLQDLQLHGIYLPVSVNVTPMTLTDEKYLERVINYITPCADYIHIEVTEETLLADKQALTLAFNQLHQLGATIHIDDFGTGYSSMSYLTQFDIDCIKIDRSFVLELSSEKGRKVFSSLLSIAEQLDLKVVIEGVETEAQLSHVPRRADISVQGWYYAKSMPLDKLRAFVLK
jgi:EAL domain-containing protein (putative c-di-GMP-specific phosphodiesterase class I)